MLFHLLGIGNATEWLNNEKSSWESTDEFQKLKLFVSEEHVTNDLAEKGVKLMSDFINKMDEAERQALLQVVEFHRRQFPNLKKETLRKLKWKYMQCLLIYINLIQHLCSISTVLSY